MAENCGVCKFYEGTEKYRGYCRRYAPRPRFVADSDTARR